jgi:hypothetical protein
MGTGTPSCPSGHKVQEHVGTHMTQHSSPHGHGDTIPSIRSESTRTRGNMHVTRHVDANRTHQVKIEMWAKTGFCFLFVLSQTNRLIVHCSLSRFILRIANLLIANLLSGHPCASPLIAKCARRLKHRFLSLLINKNT